MCVQFAVNVLSMTKCTEAAVAAGLGGESSWAPPRPGRGEAPWARPGLSPRKPLEEEMDTEAAEGQGNRDG